MNQLEIVRVPIDSIYEDPANARKHPDRNRSAIQGSLKHFGQVEPLVVQKSTGKVIGGNGRLREMKEMGWNEVDVVYVDVDDIQAASLGIALNRTGELAEWDQDALVAQLAALREEEINLDELGWGQSDLDRLLDWQGAPPADTRAIADYDPMTETFVVQINGVASTDKDAVVNALKVALIAGNFKYEVDAY